MRYMHNKVVNIILKCQLFLTVGILLLVGIFLIFNLWWALHQEVINNKAEPVAKQEIKQELNLRARINGEPVVKGDENIYPVAITIDNHFDSWPNYGLNEANIVYETLVEGSTTRFLAIYTPTKNRPVKKIGPVRSTRPYFLDIVKEYDALHAHSGGSPEALQKIEEMKIHNLEEIAWWGPDYFWRVYSRQSPHNLFTSSDNLRQGIIDWELIDKVPSYRAWKFAEKINTDNPKKAKKIKIHFSQAPVYNAGYEYASSTKEYLRFQGERKHIDALIDEQVAAKNVVVQFVSKKKVLDNKGRIALDLIGNGEAWVFRDGLKIEGSWRKRNRESRTVFYDENDEEIKFKPGNVWVEIVPEGLKVIVE